MADIVRCILISGPASAGKSCLALAYAHDAGIEGDVISFDNENGQVTYVTENPQEPDLWPKHLKFYAHRLMTPNLEEMMAVCQKVKNPKTDFEKLTNPLTGKPFDKAAIRRPAALVMNGIHTGKVNPRVVIFDTVTRPWDLSVQATRRDFDTRYRDPTKMSSLMWGAAREVVGETVQQLVDAGVHIILVAWPKNRFDEAEQKPTKDLIPDMPKNLFFYPHLGVMLIPQRRQFITNRDGTGRPGPFIVPKATVIRSRYENLPEGFTLARATWADILAQEPVFVEPEVAQGVVPEATIEEEPAL